MHGNYHTWHNQNIEFTVFKVKQLTKSPACTRSSLNKIEYLKEGWEAFLLISSRQQLLLLVPEQAKCIQKSRYHHFNLQDLQLFATMEILLDWMNIQKFVALAKGTT
jgi:hypothetical protein